MLYVICEEKRNLTSKLSNISKSTRRALVMKRYKILANTLFDCSSYLLRVFHDACLVLSSVFYFNIMWLT